MKNATHNEIILRVDAKGRITLGKLAEGISSFRVIKQEDGRIILRPYVEIPLHMLKNYKKNASNA